MMEPPVTSWPPNALTPSRCALESRPFFELPNPFLCAIAESLSQALLSAVGVSVHLNGVDANLREALAMSLQLLVLLLPLVVEDQDLVPAALADNGSDDFRAGRAAQGAGIAREREHVAEFERAV